MCVCVCFHGYRTVLNCITGVTRIGPAKVVYQLEPLPPRAERAMARVLGVEDDLPSDLRSALLNSLRVYDEARTLPVAHRSAESGTLKNIAMRLSGSERGLTAQTFSQNWFTGVSVVPVPTEAAERVFDSAGGRKEALRRLVAAIPSELADAELEVGPQLEGDENDRDTAEWTAGFDAPSCCVGLYSAQQTCAPGPNCEGMERVHRTYYLVAKAGGGIAAQTFHARLTAALAAGSTLDDALDGNVDPGPQALRRVALAASRNRGRILLLAAKALGIDHAIDTLGDQASPDSAMYRIAVAPVNVVSNALRRVEASYDHPRSLWQYTSGCVDTQASTGLITCSNAQQGFVLFTNDEGDLRVTTKNDLYDVVPFASERRLSNRDAVMLAADAHKKQGASAAHPDGAWMRERFGWRNKDLQTAAHIEPPSLWGAFLGEAWISRWGREVGVASLKAVTLSPEVVCVASCEAPKLRAAVRHIKGSA